MELFGQEMNVAFVLITSIGVFLYRRNYKFQNREKILFLLGITFICIGCNLIILTYGLHRLTRYLLMTEFDMIAKPIYIGYIFIIISILCYIDEHVPRK